MNIDNEYSGISKIANIIPNSKVLGIYVQIPKVFIVSKNSLDYIETGYLENIRVFYQEKGRI